MAIPSKGTPIPRCIQAACYTERMLQKFPQRPALIAAAQTLSASRIYLKQCWQDVAEADMLSIYARADLVYTDHIADGGVKEAQRQAKSADGPENDRICQAVFKDGITPIVRPVGQAQCDEMRKLEGRLEAAAPLWSDAAKVKGDIEKYRSDYELMLSQRRDAKLLAFNKRAVRDMAKEDLLDVFAKVQGIVKTEFPRNKAMQDMFFMELSDAGAGDEDEGDEDAPAAAGDAGGGGAGAGTP